MKNTLEKTAGAVAKAISSIFDFVGVPAKFKTVALFNANYFYVGRLSEEEWRAMNRDTAPCGKPGCSCHEDYNAYLAVLRTMRAAYAQNEAHKNQPAG